MINRTLLTFLGLSFFYDQVSHVSPVDLLPGAKDGFTIHFLSGSYFSFSFESKEQAETARIELKESLVKVMKMYAGEPS